MESIINGLKQEGIDCQALIAYLEKCVLTDSEIMNLTNDSNNKSKYLIVNAKLFLHSLRIEAEKRDDLNKDLLC